MELAGKRDVNTSFCWGNSKVREYLEDRGVDGPVLIRHYEDVRQTMCVCVLCLYLERQALEGCDWSFFCTYIHDELAILMRMLLCLIVIQ